MNCPSCAASVSPKLEYCPQCLQELPRQALVSEVPAGLVPPEPAAPVPSHALPAPVADPPMATEEGPICSTHPYTPGSTCRQCNASYCARCLPEAAKAALCATCNTAIAVREAPEKLRGLFQQLWISPLVMGLAIVVGMFALGASRGRDSDAIMGGIMGAVASSPFFLMALIIAWTKSTTAAWIGFALELLVLLPLVLGGGLCVAPVALIVAIMTVFQIRKIEELRALLRAPALVK